MKTHGSQWAAMSAHHKRDFKQKAAAARLNAETGIEEERGKLQADV